MSGQAALVPVEPSGTGRIGERLERLQEIIDTAMARRDLLDSWQAEFTEATFGRLRRWGAGGYLSGPEATKLAELEALLVAAGELAPRGPDPRQEALPL